jgi:DNA-binding IclR family transcriptional regulator
MSVDSPPGSVQVLTKAVRVLDCFSPDTPRLTVAEIKRATTMPTTTVARLVKTLVDLDLLQRIDDRYSIGLRPLGWTASATAGSELLAALGPVLIELRDLSGETAGAYVQRGHHRVAVAVELSHQSVVYQCRVGQVMPMNAGAAGKVFMAFSDSAFANATRHEELGSGAPQTDPSVHEQLDLVRRQGWAYTQEEREAGLNSLAAPVRDASGSVVAAIAIGGPSFRLTPQAAQRLGPEVLQAADRLSRRLGTHDAESPEPLIEARTRT